MKKRKIAAAAIAVGVVLGGLTACMSDSDTVSRNLSTESEQFRVQRKIVFYNAITDKYIATVEGLCSIDKQEGVPGGTLAVTCRIGPDKYIKDYLGKSDNVTWFMIQSEAKDVSRYHYEFVLKPEAVVPDIRVEAGEQ